MGRVGVARDVGRRALFGDAEVVAVRLGPRRATRFRLAVRLLVCVPFRVLLVFASVLVPLLVGFGLVVLAVFALAAVAVFAFHLDFDLDFDAVDLQFRLRFGDVTGLDFEFVVVDFDLYLHVDGHVLGHATGFVRAAFQRCRRRPARSTRGRQRTAADGHRTGGTINSSVLVNNMDDEAGHAGGANADGGGAKTRRETALGGASVALLVATSAVAFTTGRATLFGIAWVAFLGMTVAGWFGAKTPQDRPHLLVWGYGLSAGAMVTSAAVFLLPQAMRQSMTFGGFGVATGLLVGFAAHTLGHRLAHMDLPFDRTLAELTAHAVSAGAIIGIIYGNMELGALLGLAIVSHKGPAGYAAVHRYVGRGGDWTAILLPAAGVGVAAIASSFLGLPASDAVRGVVFGFATGVFVHIAMDFLPECELGSEVHESLEHHDDAHRLLDRLRVHAVASTALGGVAVFVGWLLVA